jgi:IPT/TIG domain-containing protein
MLMARLITRLGLLAAAAILLLTDFGHAQRIEISSLTPAQGPVGTAVVITGVGFSATDNAIHFGVGGIPNVASGNGGTTMAFAVPQSIGPHDFNPQIMLPNQPVTPGTYEVFVINAQTEKSNSLTFTVTPKS